MRHHRIRVDNMIYNHRTKSVLPETGWVFTGSRVVQGRFKANVYGSFVMTYWDPWAIFNIDHAVGADDEALLVNSDVMPPEEADVILEFRLRRE